jgi:hypothetical protein
MAVLALALIALVPSCYASREKDGPTDIGIPINDSETPIADGVGGAPSEDGDAVSVPDTITVPHTVLYPEPKPACDGKYKPGLICKQNQVVCIFYVVLDDSTCLDYCKAHGGECLAAWSDSNDGCEIEEPRECEESASDQICACTLATSERSEFL